MKNINHSSKKNNLKPYLLHLCFTFNKCCYTSLISAFNYFIAGRANLSYGFLKNIKINCHSISIKKKRDNRWTAILYRALT